MIDHSYSIFLSRIAKKGEKEEMKKLVDQIKLGKNGAMDKAVKQREGGIYIKPQKEKS